LVHVAEVGLVLGWAAADEQYWLVASEPVRDVVRLCSVEETVVGLAAPDALGGFALDSDTEVADLVAAHVDEFDLSVDARVEIPGPGMPVVAHLTNSASDQVYASTADPGLSTRSLHDA
jgi:hypothetical protein